MRNQLHYVGLTKIHAWPTTWWLPGRTFPRKRCGQVWEPPLGHYKYRLMLHIATHTSIWEIPLTNLQCISVVTRHRPIGRVVRL
jgi:hypothetical protein